jgi:hypothetical protein
MKHVTPLYLVVLLTLMPPALFSCSKPPPRAAEPLTRAERLMNDYPDSAMLLIYSIFYPEKSLKKEHYTCYQVARVQAGYKNYLPVAEDTLIFAASPCNFLTAAAMAQKDFEIQQKHDYEKLQNRHNHLQLKRQRAIITLFSILLAAGFFSILLLRHVTKQKSKLLSLREVAETLYKTAVDLDKRVSCTSDQQTRLREMLLWKLEVLQNSTLLKSKLDQSENMDVKKTAAKFEQVIYGIDNESRWNTLEVTINGLHPNLTRIIRRTFPQFSETEFKVCLLSYAKLSCKEIALLVNQSVHTVNKARTRIRQKMDISNPNTDFCDKLRQIYKGNYASQYQ